MILSQRRALPAGQSYLAGCALSVLLSGVYLALEKDDVSTFAASVRSFVALRLIFRMALFRRMVGIKLGALA